MNKKCLVGCQLARLIKQCAGIGSTGDCGCEDYAAELDEKSLDWCRVNTRSIVQKMLQNAKSKGMPLWVRLASRIPVIAKLVALYFVRKAIERAEDEANATFKRFAKLYHLPTNQCCTVTEPICDGLPGTVTFADGKSVAGVTLADVRKLKSQEIAANQLDTKPAKPVEVEQSRNHASTDFVCAHSQDEVGYVECKCRNDNRQIVTGCELHGLCVAKRKDLVEPIELYQLDGTPSDQTLDRKPKACATCSSRRPPIKAIVVCVEYDDLLEITLPRLVSHVDEVIVVTTPQDLRTHEVVDKFPTARCLKTMAFYRNGAMFDKGRAIEEGFDVIGRDGFILVIDADVLLPKECDLRSIKPGYLYTVPRYMLDDPKEYSVELDWSKLSLRDDPPGTGYFQLFHASDPNCRKQPWYEHGHKHAGGADYRFAKRWPESRRHRLPFKVLHLGPAETNWHGRVSDRLDGAGIQNREQRRKANERIVGRATTPPARKRPPVNTMAVITCLFNPLGWKSRDRNFARFREAIGETGLPVHVVEASWDGKFQSADTSNNLHLHANDRQVVWQKERLLNLAVERWPDYDAYAFVDADLLFRDQRWFENAIRELRSHDAVQLFSYIEYENEERSYPSAAKVRGGGTAPGGAWAYRAEFAKKVGWYDRCVVGGGDSPTWMAMEPKATYFRLASTGVIDRRAIETWVLRSRGYGASYSVIDGTIDHMFHGTLQNRNHSGRYDSLRRHNFDPQSHLTVADNGLLTWTYGSPADLITDVREYLSGRQEDG